jgi:hypothetical protein
MQGSVEERIADASARISKDDTDCSAAAGSVKADRVREMKEADLEAFFS